ncbi:hypothetical protein OEV98_06670 [Caldibacillus lycopersici]|uniref:Uncharacterized protein n=1 Tax=Perspicuibacillus lycopersici TaxID=1325689 RepID=A0AAE3ITM4_9BACI|nr:hypothetical protein [Perspicuibacillus lycopersici]MCU9613234.1 hypothetical protein [Perspicuibacillus lycopersici]
MRKLDENIKYNNLSTFQKGHLTPPPALGIKGSIALFTFIVLDLMCLLPMLADPFMPMFLWLVLPVILLVNLWAISLLVRNVYSIQLESVLFLGAFSAVGAYSFFVLVQKFAYYVVGMQSPVFLIVSLLIVLLTVIYFVLYYAKKVAATEDSSVNKERTIWSIAFSGPALGYILYQTIIEDSPFFNHFLIVVFFLFALFFLYIAVKFFHKYLFMKTNYHLVNFHEPAKSEQKQFRAKGKTIQIK